jgi:hypothetical protein
VRVFSHAKGAFALIAAASVAGCFTSRAALVQAPDSVKLFGESGLAKRVSYSRMGAGPLSETVRFTWTGDAYVLTGAAGQREAPSYRLSPLSNAWFLTQRVDGGWVDYGLARKVDAQLYVYAPQCQDLTAADRTVLGLTLKPDGACQAATLKQLRTAMAILAARNPKPEGYYEPIGPAGVRP